MPGASTAIEVELAREARTNLRLLALARSNARRQTNRDAGNAPQHHIMPARTGALCRADIEHSTQLYCRRKREPTDTCPAIAAPWISRYATEAQRRLGFCPPRNLFNADARELSPAPRFPTTCRWPCEYRFEPSHQYDLKLPNAFSDRIRLFCHARAKAGWLPCCWGCAVILGARRYLTGMGSGRQDRSDLS
jgi:hypothetical protein